MRKTRVEREALRRVRKERRRLTKQLSKPVSIQKALRIDDDLAQSTVGTRRSEAQDTIGPRRSEATAPSRASRIVEVHAPQALVDVPPQTTPHATPTQSPTPGDPRRTDGTNAPDGVARLTLGAHAPNGHLPAQGGLTSQPGLRADAASRFLNHDGLGTSGAGRAPE